MSDVILVNRTKRPKRMLVLNLTTKVAAVKVTNRVTVEDKQGNRRKKVTSKLVPDSIRIRAGGRTGPLPEAVLSCPEVKQAIAARDLRMERVEPEQAKAAPKKRRQKNSNGGGDA